MRLLTCLLSVLLLLTCHVPFALAADWPQFQGPERNGVSMEDGLLANWPEGGPPEIWRVPIGEGHSSLAVVGDLLYTQEVLGQEATAQEATAGKQTSENSAGEYLTCRRVEDGSLVWRVRLDDVFENQHGDGSRATPTVDDGWVFALSGGGVLVAVDAIEGLERWRHDLVEDLAGVAPHFGYSGSPLVEQDMVIVEIGGKEKTFGAFRRQDGRLLWRGGSGGAAYAAPVSADLAGERQILFFHATGLTSVDPDSGEVLWHDPWKTYYGTNIASPIVLPGDRVFVSASYDMGGAVLAVADKGSEPTFEAVWRSRKLKTHFHSAIYHAGHLYGFDDATLKCLDAETGAERWAHRDRGVKPKLGKGSVLVADGRLLILGDRGTLVLAQATPDGYEELARQQIFQDKTWALPALADGQLYLRGPASGGKESARHELVRLDLRSAARRALAQATNPTDALATADADACLCDAEDSEPEDETPRAKNSNTSEN